MITRVKFTVSKILSVLGIIVLVAGCTPRAPVGKPTETAPSTPDSSPAPSPAASLTPAPTFTLFPTATAIPPTPTSAPAEVWILFLNNGHVRITNGDGSLKRLLTNAVFQDTYPTWSPDGQKIAFIRIGNEKDTLYVMNADGTDLHMVGTFIQPIKSIEWAPYYWLNDSQTILISSSDQAFWLNDILLVNTASGQAEKIASGAIEPPILSSDMTQVAMILTQERQACEGKGCTNPGDIYLYDLQSKQLQRLTRENTPIFGLRWSPDGNLLAFHSGFDYENIYQSTRMRKWLQPLARLGQMSLTAYLSQSAACSLLFSAYGFGLYGRVDPLDAAALVCIINLAQLAFSWLWMGRFRNGPLEGLLKKGVNATVWGRLG